MFQKEKFSRRLHSLVSFRDAASSKVQHLAVNNPSTESIEPSSDCPGSASKECPDSRIAPQTARQPASLASGQSPSGAMTQLSTNEPEAPHQRAALARNTASAPRNEALPQSFGPYELVWELCRDALSTTYAARREGVELLAIRIFNERVSGDAEVKRVIKAARSAAELTHFNILTVYESGVGNNGAPYVVTSWVESETLAQEIEVSKRLDIGRLLHIINQVCEALIEAHSRQLIHNNLSPEKILLVNEDSDADLVKVIDFGMPPDPVKNAFYLSPEQCLDRKKVDARTDIYSLGCIMYEALTGKPPFSGYSMSQTSLNHLHELANQFSPESPEHNALKLLDCIIVKCLQKKPLKRFGSIRELKDALRLVDECIRGGSTKKLPPSAERLLIFRFLDLFDRKISIALFTYLLLGFSALKFNAEIQLQKYIDEGQLAVFSADFSRAEMDWRLAIKQAEFAHKPPSLLADLHWELADCLSQDADTFSSGDKTNGLRKEAISQYDEAFKYFKKGSHFKSSAIQLLEVTGDLWLSMRDKSAWEERKSAVRNKAGILYRQNKYAECAAVCKDFLSTNANDPELAELAGCAYDSIAVSLPPEKALRFFERSAYYFSKSANKAPYVNLILCETKLFSKHHRLPDPQKLAAKALARGDYEAAAGEANTRNPAYRGVGSELFSAIISYEIAVSMAYSNLQYDCPTIRQAIDAWERALVLEEETYGKHSPKLSRVLSSLAGAYRLAGMDDKALKTYARYFDLNEESTNNNMMIPYIDLLVKHKQLDKARKILLSALRQPDGSIQKCDPLYVRLVKAYADCKMKGMADQAVSDFVAESPPDFAFRVMNPFTRLPLPEFATTGDAFEQ